MAALPKNKPILKMKFYKISCYKKMSLTIALYFTFCFYLFSMSSPEGQFPLLHAHDLNGKSWILPHDLSAQKTLLLVAFKRQQQDSVDSWINALELRSPKNHIAWIEVPLLQRPWKLVASWIDHGMRRGVTEEALRAHVWTTYTNRSLFLKTLGLTGTKSIVVLVVNKKGAILEKVSGDYTKNKAQVVLKALHSKP